MTTSALLAVLFLGSLFHINVGPEVKMSASMDIPAQYMVIRDASGDVIPQAETIKPDTAWWTFFNELVLDACIDEAFRKNRDLEMALARVARARAVFKDVRADQLPKVGGEFGVERSRVLENADGATDAVNSLLAAGTVSYEADLWGKLQKSTRAAKEDLLATEAAKNSVRLALAGQVAKTYFTLRGTDLQLQVTQNTLRSQIKSLELNRLQYAHGSISKLELRRDEAVIASTGVQVRQLETDMVKLENSLLVLLGRDPKDFIDRDIPRGVSLGELPDPQYVPIGVPVQLLLQRPDVKQAQQNYLAALARIGAARAGQYPSIAFDGIIGTPSNDPSDLFHGATGWSLASQLTAPIFNAGQLSSRVRQAEASAQEAFATYYKTVQTAFEETVNAIVERDNTDQILDYVEAQEYTQKRAYDLAYIQYREGRTNQLDLLDAERQLLAVQLQLEGARAQRLGSIVDFCLAVGGGWQVLHENDLDTVFIVKEQWQVSFSPFEDNTSNSNDNCRCLLL